MYRYQPLDLSCDSIRVLRLDPAKNAEEPLTGWIYPVEITKDKILQLSAISYAAEGQSPSRRHRLTCFDKTGSREGQIHLTKNASAALKAVRSRDLFRRVWIDRVCIDQSNLDERNHQARLGEAVFSTARTVIIWLGDQGTDRAKKGLEFVGKFRVPNTPENYQHRHRLIAVSALARKAGHDTILGDLFRRPWFQRTWTFQEMVLCPNHIIVVCGGARVSWNSFIYALSWLADLDKEQFSIINESCRPYLLFQGMAFEAEAKGRQSFVSGETGSLVGFSDLGGNLFDLVGGLHGVKRAADPRDMIFGVYGLAQRLGYNISPPDYQKSTCQVYIEAAISIIEYDNGLRILKTTQHRRRNIASRLPSWVPDWSVDNKSPRQRVYLEQAMIPSFRLLQSPSACTFSPDGSKLTVKGRILDRIARTSRSFPDPSGGPLDTWAVFRDCVGMIRDSSTSQVKEIRTSATLFHLFEDALLGALLDVNAGDPVGDYRHDTFISLCSMATLSRSEIRDIVAVGNTAIHEMDADDVAAEALELLLLSPNGPKTGEYSKLYSFLGSLLEGRCFFVSAQGWMGTSFGTAVEADVVAMLVGLDIPVVLSPDCEGNFRFVGLAYVPEVRKNGVRVGSKPNLRRITLV